MSAEIEHQLPDELMHANVSALKTSLDALIQKDRELWLDATQVARMDESGLQFLLVCLTRLAPLHMRAVRLRANAFVHERLLETGFDSRQVEARAAGRTAAR